LRGGPSSFFACDRLCQQQSNVLNDDREKNKKLADDNEALTTQVTKKRYVLD
jgi:hypothetical protein